MNSLKTLIQRRLGFDITFIRRRPKVSSHFNVLFRCYFFGQKIDVVSTCLDVASTYFLWAKYRRHFEVIFQCDFDVSMLFWCLSLINFWHHYNRYGKIVFCGSRHWSNIKTAAMCGHGHTTRISKQFHASTERYINETFILHTIHKIHEQSIFPRSFIFVFNSRIDSLYLID